MSEMTNINMERMIRQRKSTESDKEENLNEEWKNENEKDGRQKWQKRGVMGNMDKNGVISGVESSELVTRDEKQSA